jgi:hypothetical protein
LEVIRLLEPHRSEFSTSAKSIFTLGLSYYKNGSYSRAIDLFDIATRLDLSTLVPIETSFSTKANCSRQAGRTTPWAASGSSVVVPPRGVVVVLEG